MRQERKGKEKREMDTLIVDKANPIPVLFLRGSDFFNIATDYLKINFLIVRDGMVYCSDGLI